MAWRTVRPSPARHGRMCAAAGAPSGAHQQQRRRRGHWSTFGSTPRHASRVQGRVTGGSRVEACAGAEERSSQSAFGSAPAAAPPRRGRGYVLHRSKRTDEPPVRGQRSRACSARATRTADGRTAASERSLLTKRVRSGGGATVGAGGAGGIGGAQGAPQHFQEQRQPRGRGRRGITIVFRLACRAAAAPAMPGGSDSGSTCMGGERSSQSAFGSAPAAASPRLVVG